MSEENINPNPAPAPAASMPQGDKLGDAELREANEVITKLVN